MTVLPASLYDDTMALPGHIPRLAYLQSPPIDCFFPAEFPLNHVLPSTIRAAAYEHHRTSSLDHQARQGNPINNDRQGIPEGNSRPHGDLPMTERRTPPHLRSIRVVLLQRTAGSIHSIIDTEKALRVIAGPNIDRRTNSYFINR